ncbi:MAG: GTP 3',8-cyclase MoaA [Planctomycetota bacterium]|jgi:cyclic pyranopterin phosphate synthase
MAADYLRVSVTDRCNLRCVYCYPSGGCDLIERREILRFEEICHVVRLFAICGIRKVRLTGGEPLIRSDIVDLVGKLAGIEGIEELALTTNGVLLEQMAEELKNAGLHRINISVDSTERQSYKDITGFDNLANAMKGIYKALDVGLAPVKINCVIIKGLNISQIIPLAQMSVDLPVAVRFIEYCPTSRYTKPAGDFVSTTEIRRVIEDKYGLLTILSACGGDGPALQYKIKNAAGTTGFISGRSSIFCHNCNRIRLTSDGMIKPCLYSSKHYNIKQLIRAGANDEDVAKLLKEVIEEKDRYTKLSSPVHEFDMQKIGG